MSFWDREVDAPTHSSWMAHPLVRAYINERIGGWPLDWFQGAYPDAHFARGLSIGCGTGALERDVVRRGLCDFVDAFDASPRSIELAREAAANEGLADRIAYTIDDFDRVRLPRRRYDIVFCHQSLHHVSRLERLLRLIMRALKPGGLLYLDEFVGPSRTYWNPWTVSGYRAMYPLLPAEIRFPEGFLMPVQYDDVSEALRSGEIRSTLRIGYHVEHERGYGGNVLAVLFPSVYAHKLSDDLVRKFIEADRSVLDAGVPSFHAVIVARPKRGLAGLVAQLRYLVRPKLLRVGREVNARLGGSRARDSWE